MKYQKVYVSTPFSYLPEQRLSSEELEGRLAPLYQRLDLPMGRLELMTGIKERGIWSLGTKPSSLAVSAARLLMDKMEISPEKIDLLIHASVCRDFLEPATASVVHEALRLPAHAQSFDLSNACLGVMSAIEMAARQIEAGQISQALIVSGENGAPLIEETVNFLNNSTNLSRKDIKKYFANLTIGSAAVAVLVSDQKYPLTHQLKSSYFRSDTSTNRLCQGDGNHSALMMETDSEALMQAGVALAHKTWSDYRISDGAEAVVDAKWLIGHQVGLAHETLMRQKLGLEHLKSYSTFSYLGNTGSAAWPVTLGEASRLELLRSQETVLVMGIGSGLHCGIMEIVW
jgi:3-oxoacyl-[acyl-carrier-protein] synthase III